MYSLPTELDKVIIIDPFIYLYYDLCMYWFDIV